MQERLKRLPSKYYYLRQKKFELLCSKQLQTRFKSNRFILIYKKTAAFRLNLDGHIIETALVRVNKYIMMSIDHVKSVLSVLLDLSTAFDKPQGWVLRALVFNIYIHLFFSQIKSQETPALYIGVSSSITPHLSLTSEVVIFDKCIYIDMNMWHQYAHQLITIFQTSTV